MCLKSKSHPGWYFLLMVSPLLPDKWGLIPIYAFILVFILSRKYFKSKSTLVKHQKWILWLTLSFFLFYTLSLFWGGDLLVGIKSVEKKLLFLILPVLFLSLGKKNNEVGKSVAIFVISVNLALVVCLGIALYQASIYIGFQTWPFKYYNFTYWIGMHPGYLSLLVLLSLTCTGFMLKEKKGRGNLWRITLLFQVFMLFFIGAKFALFSFVISLILFLFLFKLKKGQILIVIALFLSLVFFALFTSANSLGRILNVKEALAARIELDKAGINLFMEKSIIGYGAGNIDDKLLKEYLRLNIDEASSKNYNIHNQYLQTLLTTGILGFALLMAPIVLVIKFADNRAFAFLILFQFLTFFLIESVLVRQKGVVAFVSWLLFLSLYSYKKQLSLSDNKD